MEGANKLDNAIRSLFAFSLAKRKYLNSFWIHPLVHAWARERNDITKQLQHAENALTLVSSAFTTFCELPFYRFIYFERHNVSHLEVVQGYISKYCSTSIRAADASSNIAKIYGKFRYFRKAEVWYLKAFTAYEKALGSEHNLTLKTIGALAKNTDRQGNYHWALEWYQKKLVVYQKKVGEDHPETLDIVRDMASIFKKLERYDETIECHRRTLTWKRRHSGKTTLRPWMSFVTWHPYLNDKDDMMRP
ncbi:hypothetical protein RUND412_000892 [Rhizina undulata]